MSCKVLPNLFHDSVKFHWEFLPRICWGVQGAGTQGPGTKTAFLVGRCPNLQEQPQPELLPLGKGSRNLRNVRSGICWTKQCLCSALTFPAPILHYLAPQNWLLSSAWEQKSCKEPGSKEGEVHSVADTSLTPAGATFPGSGGILRTVTGHILCWVSLPPLALCFQLLGLPLPLPPPPQRFPAPRPWLFLKWKVYPGWVSSWEWWPNKSFPILPSLRQFHTQQQMLGKSSRGKGPESTRNDRELVIRPKLFSLQYQRTVLPHLGAAGPSSSGRRNGNVIPRVPSEFSSWWHWALNSTWHKREQIPQNHRSSESNLNTFVLFIGCIKYIIYLIVTI